MCKLFYLHQWKSTFPFSVPPERRAPQTHTEAPLSSPSFTGSLLQLCRNAPQPLRPLTATPRHLQAGQRAAWHFRNCPFSQLNISFEKEIKRFGAHMLSCTPCIVLQVVMGIIYGIFFEFNLHTYKRWNCMLLFWSKNPWTSCHLLISLFDGTWCCLECTKRSKFTAQ